MKLPCGYDLKGSNNYSSIQLAQDCVWLDDSMCLVIHYKHEQVIVTRFCCVSPYKAISISCSFLIRESASTD